MLSQANKRWTCTPLPRHPRSRSPSSSYKLSLIFASSNSLSTQVLDVLITSCTPALLTIYTKRSKRAKLAMIPQYCHDQAQQPRWQSGHALSLFGLKRFLRCFESPAFWHRMQHLWSPPPLRQYLPPPHHHSRQRFNPAPAYPQLPLPNHKHIPSRSAC